MPIFHHLLFAIIGLFIFNYSSLGLLSYFQVFYFSYSFTQDLRFSKSSWINPLFFYKFYLVISSLANIQIINLFASGIFLVSYNYAKPEQFNLVSLLWFLGNMAIIIGFEMSQRSYLFKLKWEIKSKSLLDLLYIVSITLIFKNLWLSFSLPGTFNQLLELTPLISILFFSRIGEMGKSRQFFIRALVLTILASGYNILFAYLRTAMILPILVFFLGILSSGKGLRPLRSMRFIPIYAFAVLFLLFFETFGAKRSQLSYGFNRLTELQLARETTIIQRKNRLTAFERISTIGQLSAIGGIVEENGFYEGRASKSLATALIPRFLWPEKPKIALGVWFAVEIGAALKTETWYNTSINMTIPGNLFLDFGWTGAILGGIFIGAFLHKLWNATNFNSSPLNFTGTFFGGYLLYTCFLGFGADLQILVTMLALYLILLGLDRTLNSFASKSRYA